MRLKIDKYIALNGYCSRRKAYDLISERKVLVNGKTATHSTKFNEGDVVAVEGKKLKTKPFVPV